MTNIERMMHERKLPLRALLQEISDQKGCRQPSRIVQWSCVRRFYPNEWRYNFFFHAKPGRIVDFDK